MWYSRQVQTNNRSQILLDSGLARVFSGLSIHFLWFEFINAKFMEQRMNWFTITSWKHKFVFCCVSYKYKNNDIHTFFKVVKKKNTGQSPIHNIQKVFLQFNTYRQTISNSNVCCTHTAKDKQKKKNIIVIQMWLLGTTSSRVQGIFSHQRSDGFLQFSLKKVW